MSKNITPEKKGFFGEILVQIRLVIRLIKDQRINPFLKILPFLGLVYLIIPDLVVPDLIIGPIDDTAVIFLGSYFFIELCPQTIVQEHLQALRSEGSVDLDSNNEVIDADYRDLDE